MRPFLLITNDDGIFSPGLLAAAEAVSEFAELLICAPRYQQTTMSRSFPRTKDLGIIDTVTLQVKGRPVTAYGIHGSPAYAVAHGIYELAPQKPDLCISGINYGENLGLTLSCSGTIGAALEADSHNIPAIAVSKQVDMSMHRESNYAEVDWKPAQEITAYMVQKILEKGMPKSISILNINVPDSAKDTTKFQWTRQSRQNYFLFQKPKTREWKEPFELQSKLVVDEKTLEPDSDIKAVYIDKVISVTPLTWDMTAPIPLRI